MTWADSLMTGGMTIIAMLLFIDWRLTIIAVLPLPLLALVSKVLGDKIHVSFEHAQEDVYKRQIIYAERSSRTQVLNSLSVCFYHHK